MKKYLPLILVCLIPLSWPGRSQAQFFSVPDIKGEEVCSYMFKPKETKETKKFLNTIWGVNVFNNAMVQITNRMEETHQGKRLNMTMEGKDERMGCKMVTHNSFQVTPEGLKQTLFEKKIMAIKTGEVFYHYEIRLDKKIGVFPPNTYTQEAFPMCVRGLDLVNKQRLKAYWLANERQVMPLYTKVKSPVEITVNAGKFLCYRVETWPDLADYTRLGNYLFKLVSPFMPVSCMYLSVAPPHQLIAFDGPPGLPGSTEVFGELMKMEASTEK